MEIVIKDIDFQTILPIWKNKLWPERNSVIEPISAINISGEIDGSIIEINPTPHFFSFQINGEICAVTSVHQTNSNEYRLRGTWVDETYRGCGHGKKLIKYVLDLYLQSGGTVWTMSREDSVRFYEKMNFQLKRKILGYEYGPHFIMVYKND
jgi:GNAT superfamily N-acetyltransferase